MFIAHIITLVIAFGVILYAGSLIVRTITRLAEFFGLSEFVAAFILVSFATSSPELGVGITSAIQGASDISLGNILGANLISLAFFIGLIAFAWGGIPVEGKISLRHFWLVFIIAFLPILMAVDGELSRGDGILMLIVFGLYIAHLFSEREYFSKKISDNELPIARETPFSDLFKFGTGIVLLIGGAYFAVESATALLEHIKITSLVFGMVFIAIGTTLPELIFEITAARKGHPSLVLGDNMGTIAFNSTGIMGLVALIHPIEVDFMSILPIAIFLFFGFVFLNFATRTKAHVSRAEGLVLLSLYIVFLVTQVIF